MPMIINKLRYEITSFISLWVLSRVSLPPVLIRLVSHCAHVGSPSSLATHKQIKNSEDTNLLYALGQLKA